MGTGVTTLTLKAKQDHLQNVASTTDPVKAIAEFVWNGLDADATRVDVLLVRNELGGLVSIAITDNGYGITHSRAEHDFESVGESWKRDKKRSIGLSRALHGKAGVGRLRFYSLAERAKWHSTYAESRKHYDIALEIQASRLHLSEVSAPVASSAISTGTRVELGPLKQTFDWLLGSQAKREFCSIFAPYVLQYPNVVITYDGTNVDPNELINTTFDPPKAVVVGPNRTIDDLQIKIIEWKESIEARRIYFGTENGIVLGGMSANIQAPGFEFSIYAYSSYFQEVANAQLLEFDGLTDPDFARALEYIREIGSDYFRGRQSERAGHLIEDLKSAGVYPYEGDPRDDIERRERQVFDIAAHAVSSYSRDFKRADNPIKKITLSLLKEAVSRNPESLTRILSAVFDLPKVRQDEFSGLLARTELANIISASAMVADRIVVLKVLSQMVFDPKHRQTVKERGELDVLIRDNSWIFGEAFHITMPEVGLTKVMDRVSEDLATTRRRGTKARKLDGTIGRVDAFLGRLVPQSNRQHREYLLVELKRPSKVVGRKELQQVEDYVNAIVDQPDFRSTSTSWHFYLVASECAPQITPLANQVGRPPGLYLDQPNYKVWVKTWAELIRECEARLDVVQDKLRIEVSDEEIENRITALRDGLVKGSRPRRLQSAGLAANSPEPAQPSPQR
jgi:hypothetical protein